MDLLISIVMVIVLSAGTVLFHYEGLRFLSIGPWSMRMNPRMEMQVIMLGVLLLHVVEVTIYGGAYWFGETIVNIGTFGGKVLRVQDYMYFSVETYTSLGYGDIAPTGELRILAGFECLSGLLMLGWSASFTFLQMQLYWVRHKEPASELVEPDPIDQADEGAEIIEAGTDADGRVVPRRRRNRARRAARFKAQIEP